MDMSKFRIYVLNVQFVAPFTPFEHGYHKCVSMCLITFACLSDAIVLLVMLILNMCVHKTNVCYD